MRSSIIRFLSENKRWWLQTFLTMILLLLFIKQGVAAQGMNISSESNLITTASDSHQPDSIIVSYRETLGGTREALESASLTIFSDGYLLIYRPPYMKQSGTYEAYLEPNALNQLWHILTDRKILEFDSTLVRNKIQEVKERQAPFSPIESISDAPTTFIEIYPNRYKSSEMFEQGDLKAKKTISWRGLKWTAKKFHDIEEIQYLMSVQQQLETIMKQSDLKKVK